MAAAVGGMAYDDDGIELFRGIRLHSPKRLLNNNNNIKCKKRGRERDRCW